MTDRATQRREEILEAALELFANKGYHATGIADIATALQIGHGTFYRYFKNKRDIFDAVLGRILTLLASTVQNEPPNASTLEEYTAQLDRIGEKLAKIFMGDDRYAKIVFYEAYGVDPSFSSIIQMTMDIFAKFCQEYLRTGIENGFLRSDIDTKFTSKAITAMIFESAKTVITSNDPIEDTQRWRAAIMTFMLHGLASE